MAHKFFEDPLLILTILDFSSHAPNNLSHPKFHLTLYKFTLYKWIASSVCSSNNSSPISHSFFAHQVLASRTYAILFARFSKTTLQN